MEAHEISLTLADIAMVERIEYAVLECGEGLSDEETGVRYWRIGDILLANAHIHDLDEDICNLQCLARCIGCELMSSALRARHFRGNCWSFEPPYTKHHGHNGRGSDIRPREKQKTAMVMTLLVILNHEAVFAAGVKVLEDYQVRHDLWTEADYIYRE
ncbi:hypothetical protein [Massilia antarctica]|uniref:hypothetical protein n=1 Tax=Massilia antarctica TaxID=2765360 RepID=UPI0006BB92E7|nr:hypothetical protein [Massilia sp. H27-R4]MCY0911550.1 hypothetical protein [Massilia sp. H27-R4]CUI04834.1 hypothetical protein BN2497_4445 [Janthinobacterium sp. CG23_2]CUU28620.1 hypothetical protein BN3177_4445 [Janthinobacterium sp. CG23_2]